MGKRMLGTFLLLAAVGGALAAGGASGVIWLMTLLALGMQRELGRILQALGGHTPSPQLYFWTAAILLGGWYLPPQQSGIWLSMVAILALIGHGIARWQPSQLLSHLCPSIFAIFYVPFLLQFGTLLIRSQGTPRDGLLLLAWVVIVSKMSDIGGLFVGTFCGRHTLAREYSPTKTWEGFWGGFALSIVVGFSLWLPLRYFSDVHLPLHLAFSLSALLAVAATVSDLLESALKRLARVKDSGSLIPGIGGCLDLCDSLLLALPTAHLMIQLAGM